MAKKIFHALTKPKKSISLGILFILLGSIGFYYCTINLFAYILIAFIFKEYIYILYALLLIAYAVLVTTYGFLRITGPDEE